MFQKVQKVSKKKRDFNASLLEENFLTLNGFVWVFFLNVFFTMGWECKLPVKHFVLKQKDLLFVQKQNLKTNPFM
jgi:hypothetical protein